MQADRLSRIPQIPLVKWGVGNRPPPLRDLVLVPAAILRLAETTRCSGSPSEPETTEADQEEVPLPASWPAVAQ